jgi:hypothetical protein
MARGLREIRDFKRRPVASGKRFWFSHFIHSPPPFSSPLNPPGEIRTSFMLKAVYETVPLNSQIENYSFSRVVEILFDYLTKNQQKYVQLYDDQEPLTLRKDGRFGVLWVCLFQK